MLKKLISLALALALLSTAIISISAAGAADSRKDGYIDNSALIPAIVPDSQVELDANGTPDWVSSLILGELRIATATKEGTLQAAVSVLDHYAEMGVNGLWVCPVYDPGKTGNGYSNMGPHTIDPVITGTDDYTEGWKRLKTFIDEAHKRNIRIFLDVISWGTVNESPLFTEHPDWYTANSVWGGREFNFSNDEFVEWYTNEVVGIALKTGCDGFRYDLEPSYAGYKVDGEIRSRLLKQGRKIFTIGEADNDRGGVYDVEQGGVTGTVSADVYNSQTPVWWFINDYNIVDSIKKGEHIGSEASQTMGFGGAYHYYTNALSCHDNWYGVVCGNRLAIGYQGIFTPFIPLWYLGEEWNESRAGSNVLYFDEIDWDSINNKENRAFYEDVKAMLRIRRQYPEIFTYYPDEFTKTNICKVNVTGCLDLQPYARYAGDTAMLVIPNYNTENTDADMTVYVPFEETELQNYRRYTVTDAETGELIVQGSAAAVAKFTVNVPFADQRVLVVKASDKIPTKTNDADNTPGDTVSEPDPAPADTESGADGDLSDTTSDPEQEYVEEVVKIKKSKKDKNTQSNSVGVILAVAAAAVVLLGGAAVTVVLVRKKKKAQPPANS